MPPIYNPFIPTRRWWRYQAFPPDVTVCRAHTLDCPMRPTGGTCRACAKARKRIVPACGYELVEVEKNPYLAPLAYASTALILMIFAYSMMFLTVSLPGGNGHPHAAIDAPIADFVIRLRLFGRGDVCAHFRHAGACFYFYAFMLTRRWCAEQTTPACFTPRACSPRLRHWIMVDVFFIATLVPVDQSLPLWRRCRFGAAFWLPCLRFR